MTVTSTFTTFDYVPGGDPRQRLDVFAPDPAADLHTAVLVLHSGAFRLGDRTDVHPRCQALAARGITAIAVGYRLQDSAPWPAQLQDAQAALRWTHEHAGQLGIDARRIAVQGHSAGGLLALLMAGTATRDRPDDATLVPAAVIAYYAPAALSLTPSPGDLPAPLLLGPGVTAEDAAAASPLTYIDERLPPTILVHGAGDRFTSPASSLRLFDALTAARVKSELYLIAGQDHEFDTTPRYGNTCAEVVTSFLRAQVVERDQAAKEVLDASPFATMPPPGSGPGDGGPANH